MTVTTRLRERYLNEVVLFKIMQKKLLFDLIEDLAGEGNGRIVEVLYNKKDVNEFSISKKMELTVNQVRNILYKLSNFGLVSFTRKKDKRKGWYIYYWTLNTEKSLALIETYLQNKTKELEENLQKRENDRYYTCPSCGIEVSEAVALEQDFVCDECAEIYQLSDNTPFVRDLKSKITRNEKLLLQIKEELGSVRKKIKSKRERVAKKVQKEAEEAKALKKAQNKKMKNDLATSKKKTSSKTSKKVPKKPVTKKTASKKSSVKSKSLSKKPVPKKPLPKRTPSKTSKKAPKKSATKKTTSKKSTKSSAKKVSAVKKPQKKAKKNK